MKYGVAILMACVALGAGVAAGQGSVTGERPDCVSARALVQSLAYGYSHHVSIANHCTHAIDCQVSTDVNPQVQSVHLEANGSTDVPTFLGSPASAFVAHVSCTEQGATPRRGRLPDPSED